GIYGSGSRMVRWNDTVDGRPPAGMSCFNRTDGITVCPAPMSKNSNAFVNDQFSALRCSQFSVCGLTVNGSVLCSSLPIGYERRSQNIIVARDDVPFISLSQSADNAVCGVLLNG